jgi:hypothetical protein
MAQPNTDIPLSIENFQNLDLFSHDFDVANTRVLLTWGEELARKAWNNQREVFRQQNKRMVAAMEGEVATEEQLVGSSIYHHYSVRPTFHNEATTTS